jgi:hypothetical protein
MYCNDFVPSYSGQSVGGCLAFLQCVHTEEVTNAVINTIRAAVLEAVIKEVEIPQLNRPEN